MKRRIRLHGSVVPKVPAYIDNTTIMDEFKKRLSIAVKKRVQIKLEEQE